MSAAYSRAEHEPKWRVEHEWRRAAPGALGVFGFVSVATPFYVSAPSWWEARQKAAERLRAAHAERPFVLTAQDDGQFRATSSKIMVSLAPRRRVR